METIRIYLNNMFAGLPQTPEVLRLKGELLSTMEDKYNELKEQGKNENEAVGAVIAEFGNIDELMQAMEVEREAPPPPPLPQEPSAKDLPFMSMAQAADYMVRKRRMGLQIGIGVALCILAPACFLALADFHDMAPLLVFFLLIAAAVPIFIYANRDQDQYQFMEKPFRLDPQAQEVVQREKEDFRSQKTFFIGLGVFILILSPAALLFLQPRLENFSFFFMFVMAAAGVNCLMYAGNTDDAYNKLLQIGEYTVEKKEAGEVIGAVASVYWPVCVVIYLVWSFTSGNWHFTWLLWPIAGILFGGFCGLFTNLRGK